MLLLSLVLMIYVMLRGKSENRLWLGCFLFMQCAFILTTRMHERYQFPVLLFSLMLFLRWRDFRWLWQYLALSLMTFINQFMLLIKNNTIQDPSAPWNRIFGPVMIVMSLVNLAIFVWGLLLSLRTAFSSAQSGDRVPSGKNRDGFEYPNIGKV